MTHIAADVLYQVETEILKNIAELLGRGSIASADWKIDKLKQLGALNDKNMAIVKRYRDAIVKGAASQVEKAAMDNLMQSEAIFQRAADAGATLRDALPLEADPRIKAIIGTWQKTAKDSLNLTMTTMLHQADSIARQGIERVTAEVLTGAKSATEARRTIMSEWAESGVPNITDKAGRTWSTEAYADMVIRSNVRRVTTATQMDRAQEYGADLVEISAHAGARPACAPYQGNIYSLSGNSDTYPPFSSTSYGEIAGLFGINCGHRQYPFFEGISRQTYAPDETPEEQAKNAAQYEQSQKQRYLERQIRKAKREAEVLDAGGDKEGADNARGLVRDRQATMRAFIEDSGRTRRSDREQI